MKKEAERYSSEMTVESESGSKGKNRISIIIPVLKEEKQINSCLKNLRSISGNREIQIIVVDGHPEMTTAEVINDDDVEILSSSPGRAVQMNRGARKAKNEILLFVHADTRLQREAFDLIEKTINEGYSGGAFRLRIDSDNLWLRFVSILTSLRSILNRIPYGDQAIFIKKSVFIKTGGFKEIPIMEDVEFMKRLRKNNFKIRILPLAARTSGRRWRREGIFRCTFRNRLFSLLYTFGMTPEKLKNFAGDR